MSKIQVFEKPDDISFDDIHMLLWIANEQNRKDGFVLKTSEKSGEALKESLGKEGKCFVALDNGRLVGTLSVRFVERNRWYVKGSVADFMLIAVHPDYHGKHILSNMIDKGSDFAKSNGYNVIELDTADKNVRAINAYKHFGFLNVSFKGNPGGDHHSVIMAKWIDGCPFSRTKIWFNYNMKKFYITLRYKPGMRKRFSI